jgi:hypothetical protein
MAIAQMNWGRLRFPLSDKRMVEFDASLAQIYRLAEEHQGFIWRIPDAAAAKQLQALGHDKKTSATVSVWQTVEALRHYTFESLHGEYLRRAGEWFEAVGGPQLVIWEVDQTTQPNFQEAFDHLETLRRQGSSTDIYGWPS